MLITCYRSGRSDSKAAAYVVLLGTLLRGSLKVPHKPFGEGGLPWQVPKPNPGCCDNYAYFDIVEGFDNCVVSFR
jgi:hypothetical protein